MLTSTFQKWWFWPLIVGVLIRMVLAPITYHRDLLGHSTAGYFFAYEGVPNIYDHLLSLAPDHPLVKNIKIDDIFIYPPLSYYTLGIFRLITKPFADPNFIPWSWGYRVDPYSYPGLFWQLTLFKFPYLFIDIACAFLLAGLFDDIKKKKAAFALWIFNPVTIYATFMVGQLDILPVFFTILSLYLINKKKLGWALVCLGIGAAYKTYPLLLIPPAAFVLGKTFWEKIRLSLLGFLPYLLVIAPFLNSKGFKSMVLFAPKETKMLYINWPVTASEAILPFILVLTTIYLIAYYSRKKINAGVYFISVLLLTLSVTHFHPQWFLWVTPFLIWQLVSDSFKYVGIVVTLFVSWLLITLFFEPSLSWGLFAPVWPDLNQAPGLTDILNKYTDTFQLKSIIRSILAGASLFYCIKLFNNQRENA